MRPALDCQPVTERRSSPSTRSRPPSPPRAGVRSRKNLRPIGVFDSGIGGLTVAAALREMLPSEQIFYVGDTARVPYGGKSASTIERYSIEIASMLLAEGAKIIVVACNTASALAVPRLQELLRVPVLGVIQPGAAAAVAATRSKQIGVIGTRATIQSRAYEKAIRDLDSSIKVTAQSCPLLVPLIEEGWLQDAVTDQVIRRYLTPLIRSGIDTLVLGCTHYPLLSRAISDFAGSGIHLVDSARNCAYGVKSLLKDLKIAAPRTQSGGLKVALTDPSGSFLKIAEQALNLRVGDVQLRSVQKIVG